MDGDLVDSIQEIIDRLNTYIGMAMEMSSNAAQSEAEAASALGSLANNREFLEHVRVAAMAGMSADRIIHEAICKLESYLDEIA